MNVRYPIKTAVTVRQNDGSERIGTVFGHEDGTRLGPKFGGPFAGVAYHVRLSGNDGQYEEVVVGEDSVFPLVED